MKEQSVSEEPYSWRVRVWAHHPAKLYGIGIACTVAAFFGWLMFRQLVFSLFGFVAIAGATAEYWMPQLYRIDEKGASVRCGFSVSAITWEDVKRVMPDDGGVKLTPLVADGRMSPFRGVYLRFADNRAEVLELVERMGRKDV